MFKLQFAKKMQVSVDKYLLEGCLRCPFGATPNCKVHSFTKELILLRQIILSCGLVEQVKWGAPCYTFQNNNVLMLGALKNYCVLSFFKGSLLKDEKGLLHKPGKNSQAARLFKFTSVNEIEAIQADIKAYIFEAKEVEKAGLKVNFKNNPEPMPEELEQKFEKDPMLKTAFETLTPGRQRGYMLYFSAPKKSETRTARIEKCMSKILNGEGLHDKYNRKK